MYPLKYRPTKPSSWRGGCRNAGRGAAAAGADAYAFSGIDEVLKPCDELEITRPRS